MAEKTIKVTLIRSLIGTKQDHRATVRGLGLRKLNSTAVLEDTPAVRGMINKVRHLVRLAPLLAHGVHLAQLRAGPHAAMMLGDLTLVTDTEEVLGIPRGALAAWQQAADLCFSPSNAEAILQLPRRLPEGFSV